MIPVLSLVLLAGCAAQRPVLLPFKSSMAPPAEMLDARARHHAAVKAALKKYYPALARGTTGVQTVFFVSTAKGTIERTDLVRGVPPVGLGEAALFWRFAELRHDPLLRARGVTVLEPGEAAADTVYVVWAERSSMPKAQGPFRFTY